MVRSKGVIWTGLLFGVAMIAACADATSDLPTAAPAPALDVASAILGPCDPSVTVALKSDWSRASAWHIFGYPATKRIWLEGKWNGQPARVLQTQYVTNVLLGDQFTFLPWGRSEFPDSGLATAYFSGGSISVGDNYLDVYARVEVDRGFQLPLTACGRYGGVMRRAAIVRAVPGLAPKLLLNQQYTYEPRFLNIDLDTLPPDSVNLQGGSAFVITRTGREAFLIRATELGVHPISAHLGETSAPLGSINVCGRRDEAVSLVLTPELVNVGRGSTFDLTAAAKNCINSTAWNSVASVTPATGLTLITRTMAVLNERFTYRADEFGNYVVRISNNGVSDTAIVRVLPPIPIVTGSVVSTNRARISWGATGVSTYRVYRTTSNSSLRMLAYEGPATSFTDLTQSVSAFTAYDIPAGAWVGYEVASVYQGSEGGSSYRQYFASSKPPKY